MATVYSLICWGGRLGKAVTASSATDLVTLTNHGLRDGTGVAFTSGTLPTVSGVALALSTTYYAKWIAASTFELYYDASLTSKIDFTSAGSSLVMKSAYLLSLGDLSRWGAAGSERIYDGLAAFNTARSSAASGVDVEVCEIGMAFNDPIVNVVFAVKAARTYIHSKVNGVRSAAFHGGSLSAGYCALSVSGQTVFSIGGSAYEFDGIRIASAQTNSHAFIVSYPGCSFKNNILYCNNNSGYGTIIQAQKTEFVNNLVFGYLYGLRIDQNTLGSLVANNIFTKNGTGIYPVASTGIYGSYINNISVGNTTNWATVIMSSLEYSSGNAGITGDSPWKSTTGSTVTLTTTDFADWAGNNFRALSAAAPQVDMGVSYYGALLNDLTDAERPNYNNGGAEAFDVGCYEFDHGYGPHPASHTLTLTNVVVGSRVVVRDQAKTVTHYNEIATSSTVSITVTVYGDARDNWLVDVRKASAAPFYQRYKTLMTVAAGTSSHYVNQLPDQR